MLTVAMAVFIPLFLTGGAGKFDFWWWMACNAVVMVGLALALDRNYARLLLEDMRDNPVPKILLGLLSALALYIVFAAGNYFARLFSFASDSVNSIYTLKEGASTLRILLLMLFIIGPGEELLWRGYFQRVFGQHYGIIGGFLLASAAYTLMHLASLNIMLILAAGVCGVFWGYLYIKYESVLLNVVSHTAWDLAVFLLFPFSKNN